MDADRRPVIFGRRANPLVQKYAGLAPRGTSVDVGCGAGATAQWLAAQGFASIGIDLDEHCAWDHGSGVTFLRADARHFAFAELAPTLVNASYVLQMLGDAGKYEVLGRIASALRPGGLVLVESFTTDDPGHAKAGGHFHPGGLADWMAQAGLSLLEYREEIVWDDHAPLGRHQHGIVQAVAKKRR